jgi:poly(3-hydroxybutyrate) depolymerase
MTQTIRSPWSLLLAFLVTAAAVSAGPLPPLPAQGEVQIPAQAVGDSTGRTITVHLRYPEGRLDKIKPTTGLMLSLHNWGGKGFGGAPSPEVLAKRYDVVAIGVDYFQSGDNPKDVVPYDFGVYQTCDALRALYYVFQSLGDRHIAFDKTRIYVTGGSGGGNVSLMANKFAPHTFACVVDVSGMASLTDDIAYNLPGGSGLDARYSRNTNSPAYLSPGMQELRDTGNPKHLALAAEWKNAAKVVSIHGQDDGSCLFPDKQRVIKAMQDAGFDATLHAIGKADADGVVILNSGHSIGNRTELVDRFAGSYLTATNPALCRLKGPTDFERKSVLTFPIQGGSCTVSFAKDWPELIFKK